MVQKSLQAKRQQRRRHFSSRDYTKRSRQLYWRLTVPSFTWCKEPKQAWNALKNHFEQETLVNKLLLKKQYFRSEMKEGTSVDQHLKQMKDIADKLAAIGAPISEEDQVVTLLGSLPRSFAVRD